MTLFPISAAKNDQLSQRQYQVDVAMAPAQLDLFFVYEVEGEERCLGDASLYASVVLPLESQVPIQHQEINLDEVDNWHVAELVESGAWSDLTALQEAREALHRDVFECEGIELSEVRTALKYVCSRIRELSH